MNQFENKYKDDEQVINKRVMASDWVRVGDRIRFTYNNQEHIAVVHTGDYSDHIIVVTIGLEWIPIRQLSNIVKIGRAY